MIKKALPDTVILPYGAGITPVRSFLPTGQAGITGPRYAPSSLSQRSRRTPWEDLFETGQAGRLPKIYRFKKSIDPVVDPAKTGS